jgi:hypothetical protein
MNCFNVLSREGRHELRAVVGHATTSDGVGGSGEVAVNVRSVIGV